MFFGRAPGANRIASHNGLGDGRVLLEQFDPRIWNVIQPAAIIEDAIFQQPVTGSQRVQHDHVVGGFTDSVMKVDIEPAFCLHVFSFMGCLHLPDDPFQPGYVGPGLTAWLPAPRLALQCRAGIRNSRLWLKGAGRSAG